MSDNTRLNVELTNFFDEDKLFADPIYSDFGDFFRKSVDFFHQHPKIGDWLAAAQRANDELLRTYSLFKGAEGDTGTVTGTGTSLGDSEGVGSCSVQLGTASPRTYPLVFFVFVLVRVVRVVRAVRVHATSCSNPPASKSPCGRSSQGYRSTINLIFNNQF